tara:strand:+ start:111 stop:308 length:198 start_codon:yes stop_codon:yes gene_type:complete
MMIPFYEKQDEVASSALSEKVSKRETIEVIEESKLKNTISSQQRQSLSNKAPSIQESEKFKLPEI